MDRLWLPSYGPQRIDVARFIWKVDMQIAETIAGPQAAHSFSVVTLFLNADIVVKIVMAGLLFASLWSWAVIFNKWAELGRVRKQSKRTEEGIWSGKDADALLESGHKFANADAIGRIFSAASREWRDAGRLNQMSESQAELLAERASKLMNIAVDREVSRLEQGLGVLATIASASPFVGLFGTVWGIMNSFRSIAASNDTSLAVVAPGIAEALFATAIGLFAAIPAVIFYNKFSGDIGRFGERFDAFAQELLVRFSRRVSDRGGS